MSDKLIETRIRQHYVAEDGEWLVEKGKVKEAKMLKEACETIEKIRKGHKTAENAYYNKLWDFNKRERAVKEREEAVAGTEQRVITTIQQAQQNLGFMMDRLEEATNG